MPKREHTLEQIAFINAETFQVPREPFSFGGINKSSFGDGDITGLLKLNLC
jgi:hypothetical protein